MAKRNLCLTLGLALTFSVCSWNCTKKGDQAGPGAQKNQQPQPSAGTEGARPATPPPRPESETPPPPPRPEDARPAQGGVEKPYRCKTDDDCIMTCGQGAVSRDWYKANERKLQHCKDGCARLGNRAAQCKNGGCEAVAGKIMAKACTRQKIRWLK